MWKGNSRTSLEQSFNTISDNQISINQNRPFYSCTWPENGSEAACDPVLIQTFVIF